MPMKTTFDTARTPSPDGTRPPSPGGVPPGKSPSRSRATMTWPTISAAVRLRAQACVPVWQKVQLSVQPTWLETHKRAAVGFGDVDGLDLGAFVAGIGGRHAQQPLAGAVGRHLLGGDLGPRQSEALAELVEQRPGDVAHRREVARAAMVDPVPELRPAHAQFALGDADLGERAHQLDAGRAGEALWRGRLGGGGQGHGAASSTGRRGKKCEPQSVSAGGWRKGKSGVIGQEFVALRRAPNSLTCG